jgi:hypothetical protein
MKRSLPEQKLQITIVNALGYLLTPSTFWTHFPAGGGGLVRGAQLKSAGLRPGCPDLLFIHHGQAFWMELKAKDGRNRIEPSQIECHIALKAAGAHVEVVRSLDEALDCLHIWQIPMRLRQGCAA